jgi:hypothetical protein
MAVPDIPIPEAPDPSSNPAAYLRSIYAVRERTKLVLQKAQTDSLNHFDVDLPKFKDIADYVISIIKVCYSVSQVMLGNSHRSGAHL